MDIDDSATTTPGLGGLGGVFRDHLGNWKMGFQENTPHTNPIMAELLALRRGLLLAKAHGLRKIQIDTGCIALIDILSSNHRLYDNLLHECRSLMTKLDATMPADVFREQNSVADILAKAGARMYSFGSLNIMLVPLLFVRVAFEPDTRGTLFTRQIRQSNIILRSRDVAETSIWIDQVMTDATMLNPLT
ncbi:hypothetical protein P3L10_001540 [Capsicum annuum]|uniref:uncharacterized protein LOC107843183 n=1 Tax=Capsicum annuum TaxID=4072 RepID=UPI0007BF1368|nr:uncharacterized protein LOC107843183 [Capsicum annuum]